MVTPAMVSRAQHVHVTERETAHRWPNGLWDDRAWEDCTFMSGVELARLCHSSKIAPTHDEGERLRQAAGEKPTGGTNMDDLRRGMARRYRWSGSTPLRGFGPLWTALTPGSAAAAQGVMGVFARTSRLRRHQPSFGGKHCVLVVRVDNTDRVWWCDPLAPKGTSYAGEWVTKAQLKLFVDAIWSAGGRHVVGKVRRNYYAAVKDGARLYVRSDLKPTSKDVVIKPGPRWMPYKKYVRSGVLMVEYVNAKGVHTGHNYFVKSASVAKIKATG